MFTKLLPAFKNKDQSFILTVNSASKHIAFQNLLPALKSRNLPFIVSGSSNVCDLYICGYTTLTNNCTLYIDGVYPSITEQITLFEKGYALSTKSMNLFLDGGTPDNINKSCTLYIKGKINSTEDISRVIDLYISGATNTKVLNLFIQGKDSGLIAKSMNLTINGAARDINNSITLFCCNNGETPWSSGHHILMQHILPMFKNHDFILPIYNPRSLNNTLNLFIRRDPSEVLNLFIQGPPETKTEQLTLFISATDAISSSMNLVIPYAIGANTNSIKLYTHGF